MRAAREFEPDPDHDREPEDEGRSSFEGEPELETSHFAAHPVARRIWIAIAVILGILSLLLFGCSGNSGDSITPPTDSGDFGCSGGKGTVYTSLQLCWGDFHSHTVYSDDAATATPPPGSPEDALAWARDPSKGNLDFVAITDHAETETPAEWAAFLTAIRSAESTDFIPFAGFEYTNVNRRAGHGHKCVLFKNPYHVTDAAYGVNTFGTPNELWAALDASPAAGEYMTIPHHPAKGVDYGANMSTDWSEPYVNAAVQPLVEIYSVHGSSEITGCEEPVEHFQDGGTVDHALNLWLTTGDPGYKLGIIASTDTHRSTPGAVAEIEANVAEREGAYTGGLAAVWAEAKTRDGIWSALKGKRTYATSGARIVLEFTAKSGSEIVPMGGTITAFEGPAPVYLHVFAVGADGAGISKIEIYKNGALLTSFLGSHLDFKDPSATAPSYYRVKVYQTDTPMVDPSHFSQERAWSSPIWVEG